VAKRIKDFNQGGIRSGTFKLPKELVAKQLNLRPNDKSPPANGAFARQRGLFTIGSSPVDRQARTQTEALT